MIYLNLHLRNSDGMKGCLKAILAEFQTIFVADSLIKKRKFTNADKVIYAQFMTNVSSVLEHLYGIEESAKFIILENPGKLFDSRFFEILTEVSPTPHGPIVSVPVHCQED